MASKAIRNDLYRGAWSVVEIDFRSYFTTIPHDKLMILIKQRVVDGSMLRLIKQSLTVEIAYEGKVEPTTVGVPQGSAALAGGVDRGLALGVGGDPHLQFGRQILGELDLHRVLVSMRSSRPGRLMSVGIDVEALGLQRLGDVGRGDRAEQVALLVGPAFERDFDGLRAA